jgi:hypothetical protein
MNRIDINLFEEKVGFDSYNKKMLVRIYEPLREMIEINDKCIPKTWVNLIRYMFVSENRESDIKNINVNGYYSTIRKILKDIKVIKYEGKKLVKAENWDRFYGPEDWSWFRTHTWAGGWAEIINPNEMPY